MRVRIFVVLLSCFLLGSCYKREKNCEKFKTGTFEYKTYSQGEIIEAKIVRNDSLEIDYFQEDEPDTSKIRWINDCQYVLKKYHPKSEDEKQSFQMKIIETKGDQYTFDFSKVGETQTKEFTATRVEDGETDE